MNRFTLSRTEITEVNTKGKIQHCSQAHMLMGLAKTVSEATGKGMSGVVNSQAVINKILRLQNLHGCDEEGIQKWKAALGHQVPSQR